MVIGITGGIGSGKTTVCNYFEELGIPVYVADIRAKKLMETSEEIQQKLKDLFGNNIINQNHKVNRKAIAEKVFKDKELLEKLNGIIHPEVAKDFNEWKNNQRAPYLVYEAAIIFEKDLQHRFNLTVLVTAPKEEKIKRLLKRDKTTREEILARMENQWSDEKKEKLANFVIQNTDFEQTKAQILKLHNIFLSLVNSQK